MNRVFNDGYLLIEDVTASSAASRSCTLAALILIAKSKPKVSTMRLRCALSPSCLRRNHFHHPEASHELIENPE